MRFTRGFPVVTTKTLATVAASLLLACGVAQAQQNPLDTVGGAGAPPTQTPRNPLDDAGNSATPPPVNAGRHDYRVAANDMAIRLLPELARVGAPAWVKPGLRIVIYQADATVAGGRNSLVQSPNGDLHDKDGTTYRLEENIGGGGHEFATVDVLAVRPDAVVLEIKRYLLMEPGHLPVLNAVGGAVTTPSCAMDLWVHPDVLRRNLDLNGSGVSSSRVPYKAAGKTYDALWRQIQTDGGASTLVFDTESGLKLHTAMCAATAGAAVTIDGQAQNVGGATNLSQTTLAGVRQVDAPWTQSRLPAALQNVRELRYEGAMQTAVPGVTLPPSPVRTLLTVTGRGDDFVQLKRTGTLTIGANTTDLGTTEITTGPASLTPIAIDPADLAKLRAGQPLDRDPNTQATTTVTFAGRDRRGRDVVVISEEFPGAKEHQRSDYVYDRTSGLLVTMSYNNPFLHQMTQVSLVGAR